MPSKVNQPSPQTARFIVSFTPNKVGNYEIHVSFNGESLTGKKMKPQHTNGWTESKIFSGSPFPCPITETKVDSGSSGAKDRPPKHISVGKPVAFTVKSVSKEKALSAVAIGIKPIDNVDNS